MSHSAAAGEPIISVSGLRGIFGQTLTPEVAARYVRAFAELAPPGPLVVAMDGRPSGRELSRAIRAALQPVGRDSVDAGIAATPTTGVLIRHVGAAGGVQITASHNPAQYNGLKLFGAEGRVISNTRGQQVLARYRSGAPAPQDATTHGKLARCDDPHGPHLEAVLATVDGQRIRRRRFKVVLDSNRGAGSPLGRRLLEALGCEVTLLGASPDGQFEHTPEPLAENLATVCPAVPEAGADVGFCQDPDADRLAVIDSSGRYLGEEYTLAMCVDHVLRTRKGPVVTNCSTSRMTEDLAGNHGVPFHRSAVGEANVVDLMLAHEAVFGGEGNGGPIDPSVGLVRDSFVGMAQLLDAMAAREAPIADLADALPRYEIVKAKVPLPAERVAAGLDALAAHFADAEPDRLDGLRLDWPDRWLLVRPSNTEPIVRAVAEATTKARAQALCDEAAAVLAR